MSRPIDGQGSHREADRNLFDHRITVQWADCDPARIAYTGRIPYFALEAIDAWWKGQIGEGWYEMNIDRDTGSPFVHLSMDFRSPVTPRHELVCSVRLTRIGKSSVRFRVVGRQNGKECFSGEFVEVFVAASTHGKIPIPAAIREQLEALCE